MLYIRTILSTMQMSSTIKLHPIFKALTHLLISFHFNVGLLCLIGLVKPPFYLSSHCQYEIPKTI